MVAAIFSSWTAILRASKVGIEAAATAQRERVAMRVLQDALASARLFVANWRWYYFEAENGDEPVLSFVSRLPKSFPRGGKFGDADVRRLFFSVQNGPDGQRELVLRQAPLLMDVDEDEQDHPLVLARNVKELKFAFWDARRREWTDEWKATNTIPQMVRIALTVGGSGAPGGASAPQAIDEITRVVSVAAVGVQEAWQVPGATGTAPPGQTNLPPGALPVIPGGPGADPRAAMPAPLDLRGGG